MPALRNCIGFLSFKIFSLVENEQNKHDTFTGPDLNVNFISSLILTRIKKFYFKSASVLQFSFMIFLLTANFGIINNLKESTSNL